MVEYDNSPITQEAKILGDYSPELFYILNKYLINQINNNYNQLNNFLFINAWNNYYEGTYLEPDSKYGYSSLNALSKALFNLPFNTINNNLSNLITNCSVAIQVHVFYEDLIEEIINRTNNILVKYDLYITTENNKKMEFINQYIKKNSKANNYKIEIVKNKGRDVIPFLIQMTEIIKKYKYFCHIHSKKHMSRPIYGKKWRHYLYDNLLGNKELIREIISDFENYDKLGIIFPKNFYQAVPYTMHVMKSTKKKMDYLINKLFHGTKIGDRYFDFPAGNMFWARNEAVYQIFQKNIVKDIINKGITNQILWAIERIWLFIIKLNGFYYKKYFKIF
jgi:lipopolysaccharide biosynthesis protein